MNTSPNPRLPLPDDERGFPTVTILGVRITNVTKADAVANLLSIIAVRPVETRPIYLVNAHTLNLASADSAYRALLNRADLVLGDGTGVRWAARQRGMRMLDNLVGTDLVPELFATTRDGTPGYYLLGGTEQTVARAAEYCQANFPKWAIRGFHHGYVNDKASSAAAVESINASGADVLLVGMGNPLQEQWIDRHRHELTIPVSIGVGGLFDHWGGNLTRAPAWVRRYGIEWLQILMQQPGQKWRRYLVGNPLYLWRITRSLGMDKRH